jgi:hypothetical protein
MLQQSAECFCAKASLRAFACASTAWNRGICRTGSRNGAVCLQVRVGMKADDRSLEELQPTFEVTADD